MYIRHAIINHNRKQRTDLFVIEGVNGSGKTTLLREVVDRPYTIAKKNKVSSYVQEKKHRERYT